MGDQTESGGSGDEISDTELDKRFGDTLVIEGDLDEGPLTPAEGDELYPPLFPAGLDPGMVIPDDVLNLDQETQDRLQALLQAAGITKLAEGKNLFADPGVFRRLTSSVSCALDEAADALTRMKSATGGNPLAANTSDPLAAQQMAGDDADPLIMAGGGQLFFGPGALRGADPTGKVGELPPLLMNSQNCAVAAAQQQAGLAFSALDPATLAAAVNSTGPPGEWGLAAANPCLGGGGPPGQGGSQSAPGTPVVEEGESLLSLACSAGYYELAQVLLAMRTNVEDRGSKGDCTPLMEAASAGHSDIVKLLIAHNADVNAQSSTGNTPLMYACAGGHEEVVKALLEAQADVEIRNENGHSPLMEAASAGHVNIARQLVDNGAAVQSQAMEFKVGLESPLTLACYKGHIEMVRFLLSVGPNSEKRQEELHTALMEASMDGHLEVARHLLDSGAPVNLTSESFESPLTLAACGGHLDLVRLLLDRGAQIEDPNDEGYTPLMEAAREGHEDVVELLLDRGAEINAQTEETGETALTLASCGGFKDVVELLVDRGADLDLGANTPLMEAAQEGHLDTVRYLIQASLAQRLSIDAGTATGDTALTYAAENGHTEVCAALLDAGAQINSLQDHDGECGRTALMKAAKCGNFQTCEFFILRGADINKTTTANEHSALSLACANGHYEVTELLLLNGADPNHKLKDSSTCIIEAAKGGHTNVVQLLLDWPGIQLPVFSGKAPPSLQQLAVSAATHPPTIVPPPTLIHQGEKSENNNNEKEVIHEHDKLMQQSQKDIATAAEMRAKNAELMMAYFQQQQAEADLRSGSVGTMDQIIDQESSMELMDSLPEVPEPSAFSLTVDPGFLASFQTTQTGTISAAEASAAMAQGLSAGFIAGETGSHPAFPPIPGINITIPEQREWLLLQAQRALLKQAGDKLAPAELNQLNEILKAQFRQMFPTNLPMAPGVPPGVSLQPGFAGNQHQPAGGIVAQGTAPVGPTPQGVIAVAAGVTVSASQGPQKRKIPGAPPAGVLASPAAGGTGRTNLEGAMKDLKNLQLQDGKLALLQKGMRDAYMEGMQAREEFERLKKQSTELTEQQKQLLSEQQILLSDREKLLMGMERGTQTTLVLGKDSEPSSQTAGSQQLPEIDGAKLKPNNNQSANQRAEILTKEGNVVDVFPLAANGGAGGAAAASFNFQLPPPPPPSGVQAKQPPGQVVGKNEPIYATPTTVQQPRATVGKAHVSTQASLPEPLSAPNAQQRSQTTHSETNVGGRHAATGAASASQAAPAAHRGAVDLNTQTESNHDTALTLACAGGHEELVLLLLQRGADLEHRDKKGFTPLILAATAGHSGVVDLLLNHGASIEAQSERTKDTALSLACSGGRKEVVDILLKKNANKEHRNVSDYTPLSLAASGGYVDIIQLLLNYGAEINSRTGSKLGISPLMLAAMNGHAQAVKLLLERGSDINAQIETNRNTALTLACFQGRHEVVKLLLDYRANAEHRAKTGLTPLMEAASGGYVEVGRVLLLYEADPNAAPVPSSRDTALTIAADKGHHKFVDLLLHHVAAVDAKNKKGCTSLWLACHGGHLEAVQTLVKHGADVDASDNRKVTPLMAAFRRGNLKVVKWLVRHVNQFPSDQECARFIATVTNDTELQAKTKSCMEVIVAAKDRQAAEANKAAATLLQQLEEEEKAAETKRQAKQRQKEKKKAKRQAKKAALKPGENLDENKETEKNAKGDESEEDDSSGAAGKSKSGSPSSPPVPAPRAEPETLSEEEEEEDEYEPKIEATKESDKEKESSPKPVRGGKRWARTTNRSLERQNRKPVLEPEEEPLSATELRVPAVPMPESYKPATDARRVGVRGHNDGLSRRQRGFRTRGGVRNSGGNTLGPGGDPAMIKRVSPVPGRTPGSAKKDEGQPGWTPEQEWSRAERRRGQKVAQAHQQQQHRKHEWTNRSQQALGQLIATQDSVNSEQPQNGDWREATKKKPGKLVVSSQAIARVIGRGGQNINAIREATGAHIEVEKQQPRREQQDRHITIRGSTDASRQAWFMINGLIQDPDLPVIEIIRKIRSKDKVAIQQYSTGQPHPPPGILSQLAAPSAGPPSKQGAAANAAPPSGNQKKNFPDISVWVPSARGKQQPGGNRGQTTNAKDAQGAAKDLAQPPRPASAGERGKLGGMENSGNQSGSTEYSPFATPNYNVWQKRAEMQLQGKRMDFASVAAQGLKTVAQSSQQSQPNPSAFVAAAHQRASASGSGPQAPPSAIGVTGNPQYTSAPTAKGDKVKGQGRTTPSDMSGQVVGGGQGRSPVPPPKSVTPTSQIGKPSTTPSDAPEKAPGYNRRPGAVTPIGTSSGSSSYQGQAGGHQASAETTPPSVASLSPPVGTGSLGTSVEAISFFQDPAIMRISKSAFSSPADPAKISDLTGLTEFLENRGKNAEPKSLARYGLGLGGDHFSPISLPGSGAPLEMERPASATPMLGGGGEDADSFPTYSLSNDGDSDQFSTSQHRLRSSFTPPGGNLATSIPGGLERKQFLFGGTNYNEQERGTKGRSRQQERYGETTGVTRGTEGTPMVSGANMKIVETSEGPIKMPLTPTSAGWRGPPGGPDWSSGEMSNGPYASSAGSNGIGDLGSLSANLAKLQMDSTSNQPPIVPELFGAKSSIADWMNPASSIFGNNAMHQQQNLMQQNPGVNAGGRSMSNQGYMGVGQTMRGAGDLGMMFPPNSQAGGAQGGYGWGNPTQGGPLIPGNHFINSLAAGGQENYDELLQHLAGNILNMYRNNQQTTPNQHQFEQQQQTGMGGGFAQPPPANQLRTQNFGQPISDAYAGLNHQSAQPPTNMQSHQQAMFNPLQQHIQQQHHHTATQGGGYPPPSMSHQGGMQTGGLDFGNLGAGGMGANQQLPFEHSRFLGNTPMTTPQQRINPLGGWGDMGSQPGGAVGIQGAGTNWTAGLGQQGQGQKTVTPLLMNGGIPGGGQVSSGSDAWTPGWGGMN